MPRSDELAFIAAGLIVFAVAACIYFYGVTGPPHRTAPQAAKAAMRRAVESGHVVEIEGAWGKIPPLAKKNLDIMPRLAVDGSRYWIDWRGGRFQRFLWATKLQETVGRPPKPCKFVCLFECDQ